ncbi:RAB7L1 [Mytilus coruscus]|uniref:RAB7L1 n=1 Tax=Mytilus coruscus TaxID=42192 RepID=A0A6J8AR15_MYTCO|nr:RAB7L1 [Mytilus coruscus]
MKLKSQLKVDFALKVVKWTENQMIKLQLWDIAGQERFTSMTRVYYKDAHACVIMFDVTQRSTFQNAVNWKKDLDSKCSLTDGTPVPCLLLANKCDLSHKEVEQSEIEEMCREHDFIGWTEISVKEGLMIEEPMRFLMEEMMIKHTEMEGFSESMRQAASNPEAIHLKQQSTVLATQSGCGC